MRGPGPRGGRGGGCGGGRGGGGRALVGGRGGRALGGGRGGLAVRCGRAAWCAVVVRTRNMIGSRGGGRSAAESSREEGWPWRRRCGARSDTAQGVIKQQLDIKGQLGEHSAQLSEGGSGMIWDGSSRMTAAGDETVVCLSTCREPGEAWFETEDRQMQRLGLYRIRRGVFTRVRVSRSLTDGLKTV